MSQERNIKSRHYNRMLNKTTVKKGNKSTVSVNKKRDLYIRYKNSHLNKEKVKFHNWKSIRNYLNSIKDFLFKFDLKKVTIMSIYLATLWFCFSE